MKFVCDTETFATAVKLVSKATSSKRVTAMIPILEGIKIEARENELIISATNIDIFIQKTIAAEVLTEGEVVVTSKHFDEFLSKLGVESLEVEKTDKDSIVIRYGKNKTEFMCADAKAFPIMQQVDEDTTFQIKTADLKELLEKTVFCVSQENSRPILRGALLELEDDLLKCVALDGHRLAYGEKSVTEKQGELRKVILGKSLAELTKALESETETVKVNVQRNNILFDIGDTKITMTELQGEYLRYQEVIPKTSKIEVVVPKENLLNSLIRTGIFLKDNLRGYTTMKIGENEIVLEAAGLNSNITERLPIEKSGEGELTIAFNNKYIYEAVSRIDEENIKVKIESENKPIVITAEGYLYLILTIRV